MLSGWIVGRHNKPLVAHRRPCAPACVRSSDKIVHEIKCYFEIDGTETSTSRESTTLSVLDRGQWFAGTLDWATMGRLWDNKGGNRLRSKYLAKVARSVSADSLTCLCICVFFFSRLYSRKMNARAPGSLSQIVINGTKVSHRNVYGTKCWMRGYYEVHRIFEEDLILSIEWLSNDETKGWRYCPGKDWGPFIGNKFQEVKINLISGRTFKR